MDGYYFLTHSEDDGTVQYFTFPLNFTIISIMDNAAINYSENAAIVTGCCTRSLISEVICSYNKPIRLSYDGNVNEVTFAFKPLGLNAFLQRSLNEESNVFFAKFNPFEDYEETMMRILSEQDFEKRRTLIEAYWLSKYVGFSHPFLNELLVDLEKEQPIAELAKKYNTSRQNLTYQFHLHLGKSPSDYRKIHRFRAALRAKIKNKNLKNLTYLSYEMLFYDQSHLIKDFKSLTGLPPRKFFNSISPQEDGEINWQFV